LAAGTTFTMTPPGEEPITLHLTEVVPGKVFVDEVDAGRPAATWPGGRSAWSTRWTTSFFGPAGDRRGLTRMLTALR
jgi:hypothetical protein